MAFFGNGNPPICSTQGPATNPSTATLVAELDSTQLGTASLVGDRSKIMRVAWVLGADTNCTWQCEASASTTLNSGQEIVFIKTPTAASGEFVTTHTLKKDYRLRARIGGSTFTASVTAFIQAEELI